MPTYTRTGEGPASAVNTSGRMVEVNPGESIETYKILGTGWNKTSDEPYFKLATLRQTFTSPGTLGGLVGQRIIRVATADEGISMTANVSGNPNSYLLASGIPVDIENDGEIAALVFTGAGTVVVVGLPG